MMTRKIVETKLEKNVIIREILMVIIDVICC